MERREFIRTSCKLCVGIAGATVFSSLLTSCHPLPIYNTTYSDKKVLVPLTEFAETEYLIVRCSNVNYDIAVLKQPDGKYRSFKMKCTHADNPVEYNGNDFTCNLHGSIFTRSGTVKRGPAERPLLSMLTTIKENELEIFPDRRE
jgi:Rieske Fe-S protein